MKNIISKLFSAILIGFASLTFFLTISIFFDLFGIREKEGNYVLFVVIANFLSSFFYFFSAYGFWKNKTWTYKYLGTAFIILSITFIAFLVYINAGGIFETKTIGALIFRMVFTGTLAVSSFFMFNKKQ